MNRFRLSRRAMGALLFVMAAGILCWVMLGGREENTIHLPDGRILRVVGVTYGTNHVFEHGSPFAKLAARVGASRWARRFGYSSWVMPSTNAIASLMVWMRCTDRISNTPNRVFASVSDGRGPESDAALYEVNSGLFRGNNQDERLMAWRFENFPRRQRTLCIRLYEHEPFQVRPTRLGEIRIPSPVGNPPAPFRAPPAPINATNGELECALLSLRCGDAPPRVPLTAKYALAPWNTAEFVLRENAQPTTAWTIKRVEAFGATGNYVSTPGYSQYARLIGELAGERRIVHFASAFWPDEPDWKLVVEVARGRDFPADDTWSVRLPISGLGIGPVATNLQAEALGVKQGHLRVTPTWIWTSPQSHPEEPRRASLLLDYTPTAPDVHVDLRRAVDDRGRERRILNPSAPLHGRYQADLEIVTNANTLELHFVIHRSRKFEFQVKPTFVSTNGAMNSP